MVFNLVKIVSSANKISRYYYKINGFTMIKFQATFFRQISNPLYNTTYL